MRILGIDVLLESAELDEDGIGEYNDIDGTMYIDTCMPPGPKRVLTLVHEICHSYLSQLEYTNENGSEEEKLAGLISSMVVDFLANNPELSREMMLELSGAGRITALDGPAEVSGK